MKQARLRDAATGHKDRVRGQTLRLNDRAWRELKMLAIDKGVPAHALLIEAVNDLFVKHGRRPTA